MQISRHWRLNAQRYRLEGFRNPNGQVSLQLRQMINRLEPQDTETRTEEISRSRIATPAS